MTDIPTDFVTHRFTIPGTDTPNTVIGSGRPVEVEFTLANDGAHSLRLISRSFGVGGVELTTNQFNQLREKLLSISGVVQ